MKKILSVFFGIIANSCLYFGAFIKVFSFQLNLWNIFQFVFKKIFVKEKGEQKCQYCRVAVASNLWRMAALPLASTLWYVQFHYVNVFFLVFDWG